MIVQGVVLLPRDLPQALPGAVLHVGVLDVSEIDAPARELAAIHLPVPPRHEGAEEALPFRLEMPAPVPGTAIVTAHLDRNGDGRIQPGDYLSTESYPVVAEPYQMVLRLTPVR